MIKKSSCLLYLICFLILGGIVTGVTMVIITHREDKVITSVPERVQKKGIKKGYCEYPARFADDNFSMNECFKILDRFGKFKLWKQEAEWDLALECEDYRKYKDRSRFKDRKGLC